MSTRIRRREREAVIRALKAGVVPRMGIQHIQVGRHDEIRALLSDFDHIADGASTVRFVLGPFGSGKTFFLHLASSIALERNFVVTNADFSMTRRLFSTSGDARALYSEWMGNLSIKSKPNGGALPDIIERWISDIHYAVTKNNGSDEEVTREIMTQLESLRDLVGGYDFATVLTRYYEGYQQDNSQLQQDAIRWLRGEFSTKTEAQKALGVRTIVDDSTIYTHIKLLAAFIRHAGYKGLLLSLDEMGVMTQRINHSGSRAKNFEVILEIVNDCLQGNVFGLGFIFGGTPEFVEDQRRGLYSYGALKTRLAENSFATDGVRDLTGPIIRLENLSQEDLFILFENIRDVFSNNNALNNRVSQDEIILFMRYCAQKIGASYFQTPRDSIKSFVNLMSVLEQNPGHTIHDLIGSDLDEPAFPAHRLEKVKERQAESPLEPFAHTSSDDEHANATGSNDDELIHFEL